MFWPHAPHYASRRPIAGPVTGLPVIAHLTMMLYALKALGYFFGTPSGSLPSACIRTCRHGHKTLDCCSASTHLAACRGWVQPLLNSSQMNTEQAATMQEEAGRTLTRSVGLAIMMATAPVVMPAAILMGSGATCRCWGHQTSELAHLAVSAHSCSNVRLAVSPQGCERVEKTDLVRVAAHEHALNWLIQANTQPAI